MTLDQLPHRRPARVLSVCAPGPFRARLATLGLHPGAAVQVLRVAPLGDPLELQVGRTRLALRRHEARGVCVEPEGQE